MHYPKSRKRASLINSSLQGLMLLLCCLMAMGNGFARLVQGMAPLSWAPWSAVAGSTEEIPAEETPVESTPAEELEVERFATATATELGKRLRSSTGIGWLTRNVRRANHRNICLKVTNSLGSRNGCGALLRC